MLALPPTPSVAKASPRVRKAGEGTPVTQRDAHERNAMWLYLIAITLIVIGLLLAHHRGVVQIHTVAVM